MCDKRLLSTNSFVRGSVGGVCAAGATRDAETRVLLGAALGPLQAYIQMAARKRRLGTVRDVFLEKVPWRWL